MEADIARLAETAAGALAPDGLFWWAYPKKSSRRYASDLARDEGWAPLYGLGFGPVRQIAIDDDWSAVRFRPEAQIARGRRGARAGQSTSGNL